MSVRLPRGVNRRSDSTESCAPPAHSSGRASGELAPTDLLDEEVERFSAALNTASVAEASILLRQISGRLAESPAGLCRLGELLLAKDYEDLALQAYERALALRPDDVSSLVGHARVSRMLGLAEDAEDSLQIALAHDPRALDALLELASLHEQAESWRTVAALLARALDVEPKRDDLWIRMAAAHEGCEDFDAAVAALEKALSIDPKSTAAWNHLGMLYLRLGSLRRAESCFRKVLTIDKSCHAARANLGLALQEQGRFAEAIAIYDHAIESAPGCAEFRWNRGLAHLIQGNYQAGWPDYDVRFDRNEGSSRRSFPFQPWTGDLAAGAGLLVYAEQGLGDEIMFASCLPDLADRGMTVVLECHPQLETLFRRSFTAIEVRGRPRGSDRSWLSEYPSLSRQVAIGSLPRWLRSDSSRFPAHRGYLHADPLRVDKWRKRLASLGKGLTIGFLWRAGTLKTRRTRKSMPLEMLLPLLDLRDVNYVCLQRDVRAEERALLAARAPRITFWPEAFSDIEETAALCMALDLTIAVPATNGHLAGALGRPVWILLDAAPEWRWLWRGETTRWYPSARLWRQQRSGDWEHVVNDVRLGVTRLLEFRDSQTESGKAG